VTDTGSGIPSEHLSRIGTRFYRVDPSRAGGETRVGLGLSIVTSIVTLHGGCIDVRSASGEGTCVTLRFPAPKGAQDITPAAVVASDGAAPW
jgi:signal transduction histidine kinase